MTTWSRWMTFRAVLLLSGLSLVGYVAYRYTLFQPPSAGSLYGTIFPLSLLLAGAGIVLAVRPDTLDQLRGPRGFAVRGGLTAFGAVWMATGAMCVASFARAIPEAPLGGTIDMVHMLSDHVVLPLGIAALAWAPARVARWLGARPAELAGGVEPTLIPGHG